MFGVQFRERLPGFHVGASDREPRENNAGRIEQEACAMTEAERELEGFVGGGDGRIGFEIGDDDL